MSHTQAEGGGAPAAMILSGSPSPEEIEEQSRHFDWMLKNRCADIDQEKQEWERTRQAPLAINDSALNGDLAWWQHAGAGGEGEDRIKMQKMLVAELAMTVDAWRRSDCVSGCVSSQGDDIDELDEPDSGQCVGERRLEWSESVEAQLAAINEMSSSCCSTAGLLALPDSGYESPRACVHEGAGHEDISGKEGDETQLSQEATPDKRFGGDSLKELLDSLSAFRESWQPNDCDSTTDCAAQTEARGQDKNQLVDKELLDVYEEGLVGSSKEEEQRAVEQAAAASRARYEGRAAAAVQRAKEHQKHTIQCLTIHRALYEARAVVALQNAVREDDILIKDQQNKVTGHRERTSQAPATRTSGEASPAAAARCASLSEIWAPTDLVTLLAACSDSPLSSDTRLENSSPESVASSALKTCILPAPHRLLGADETTPLRRAEAVERRLERIREELGALITMEDEAGKQDEDVDEGDEDDGSAECETGEEVGKVDAEIVERALRQVVIEQVVQVDQTRQSHHHADGLLNNLSVECIL